MATAKKSGKKPSATKNTASAKNAGDAGGSLTPATVAPRADPARRARYKALAKQIAEAQKSSARQFDALYEAIGEVIEHELFLDGGFRSVNDYINAVIKEPPRTVLRNVRVAKYATAKEEERYGVAKLDAALAYIEAKMGGPAKGTLRVRFESLRIPVVDGEERASLTLDEASVAQIRAATKALSTEQSKRNDRRPPAERAVVRALAKFASLEDVTVRVSDNQLQLGPVALYALPELAKALASVALDREER
jgi:hypothetical protein